MKRHRQTHTLMLAETPVVLFLKIPMTTTPGLGWLTHLCMCLFTYTEFRLVIVTDHNMIKWETQCCIVLYCNDPTHIVQNNAHVHNFCLSKLWYRRLHLHLLKHSAHAKLGQRVMCLNTQTVWSNKWSWNKTLIKKDALIFLYILKWFQRKTTKQKMISLISSP